MNRATAIMMEGQNYYQSNKKRVWIAGAAILVLLLIFSLSFIAKTVTAQGTGERIKLVRSVEIQKGDTLWSIASEYITDEYNDKNEYINEIMESNGMVSDEIHAGNYIIVPYYADVAY